MATRSSRRGIQNSKNELAGAHHTVTLGQSTSFRFPYICSIDTVAETAPPIAASGPNRAAAQPLAAVIVVAVIVPIPGPNVDADAAAMARVAMTSATVATIAVPMSATAANTIAITAAAAGAVATVTAIATIYETALASAAIDRATLTSAAAHGTAVAATGCTATTRTHSAAVTAAGTASTSTAAERSSASAASLAPTTALASALDFRHQRVSRWAGRLGGACSLSGMRRHAKQQRRCQGGGARTRLRHRRSPIRCSAPETFSCATGLQNVANAPKLHILGGNGLLG
jgi:hypothetical protein